MRDVVEQERHRRALIETARARVLARLVAHEALLHDRPADRDGRGRARHRRDGGARAGDRAALRSAAREVTASVSTHVPKPHTPFQWARWTRAGDRAQAGSCWRRARGALRVKLKMHENQALAHRGHLLARRPPRRRRARGGVPARLPLRQLGRALRVELWDAPSPRRRRARASTSPLPGHAARDGAAALGPHRHRPRGRLPRQGVPQGAQGPAVARRAASRSRSCCTRATSPTPRPAPRPSWSVTTAASRAIWAR